MTIEQNHRNCTEREEQIFPGISLAFLSAHTQEAFMEEYLSSEHIFEIFHCREGRMECSIGEDYCYLAPGDLLIAKSGCISREVYLPLRHYHGLELRIDTALAPKCLSCFLQDVTVEPRRIAARFCGKTGYYISRSNPSFEHIFSELYTAPEEIRTAYSKIKVLELMLFLSVFPTEAHECEGRTISPAQAELAKSVAKYLTERMDERCTMEQAAAKFHVSETNIKKAFKAVYGVSFYAFLKARKMESAAYMLEYTDKPIGEIAGIHGYDNAGKFAGAFRTVKGMTPGEYRQKNRKTGCVSA